MESIFISICQIGHQELVTGFSLNTQRLHLCVKKFASEVCVALVCDHCLGILASFVSQYLHENRLVYYKDFIRRNEKTDWRTTMLCTY